MNDSAPKRPHDRMLPILVCAENERAGRTIADALNATANRKFEIILACGGEKSVTTILAHSYRGVAVVHCDATAGLANASLRQTYLLKLCGFRHILLAVIDGKDGADTERFEVIAAEFRSFAARAEFDHAAAIPLAQLANRICNATDVLPDIALRLQITAAARSAQCQWVCRAKALSSVPQSGQSVTVLPAEKPARIIQFEANLPGEGQSEGFIDLVVETEAPLKAGDFLAADPLPEISDQIAAHIVSTAAQRLYPGRTYLLRIVGDVVAATVTALKHRVDPRNLEPRAARFLKSGEIGFCNLSLERPVVFDRDPLFRGTHQFRLLDRNSRQELAAGFPTYALRRATNLTRQNIPVGGAERAAMKLQRPCVLWFTGLSGAGKSSVAGATDEKLHALGRHTYLLDGDNVRHGLCRDLGFTEADRVENIRRVTEVARLMVDAGLIVLVSFISPFRSERRMARGLFADGQFIEIFMDTPLPVCETRDTKGLYRKARAGELVNFTGIDSPYETPQNPDIRLRPEDGTADAQAELVIDHLRNWGMI